MHATQNMEWIKLEETTIPNFYMDHMTTYFITRLADDGRPMNDYKDLSSHAFPLFKAGHIQSVFVATDNDIYKIRCICLPEMKKDILYSINLTMDSNGYVLTASCGCPAGAGPTASCKHVCALCYALEKFCEIKRLRSPQSCTSELQKWNQPRKRKLDSRPAEDIAFIKYEYGKKNKPQPPATYDPRPPSSRSTLDSRIQTLRHDLEETGRDIVLLHLLPQPNAQNQVHSPLCTLPPPPPVVREKFLKQLRNKPQPLNLSDISKAALAFVECLKYTKEQRAKVEVETRVQSLSRRWFEERQFRITASKFGIVIKRVRQHTSLASQLLYTSLSPAVKALQWGREHEPVALQEYSQALPSTLSLTKAGIFIDESGYLGASPDGVVVDEAGHPIKLVEVKCPFSARDKTIKQACAESKPFCCDIIDDKCQLKVDHEYYFQIMGQMAITGVSTCDFVVWTTKDIHVQTINFDSGLWINTCLPKLKHFYFFFMLPEILYPNLSSPHDYSLYKSHMYNNC